MREGFKQAILELGERDDFLLLTGDHGYSLFDEFKEQYPGKFLNMGVAESNMVCVAAGLARAGFRPLIYGLAAFLPNRVYEFLKLQIALDSLPVTVIGDGGGLVYSTLGHSHQAIDDLALIGSLPNFQAFSPSSSRETATILLDPLMSSKPKYLRLGKSDETYRGGFPGGLVAPYLARRGVDKSIAIVSHGSMTSIVLEILQHDSTVDFDVWSFPEISELGQSRISQFSSYSNLIVVEEHLEHGGLGSRFKSANFPHRPQILSISASPGFHIGVGSYPWALQQHDLGIEQISRKIKDFSMHKSGNR